MCDCHICCQGPCQAPGARRLVSVLFQFPKPRFERPRKKRLTEQRPLTETWRKRECVARICRARTRGMRLPRCLLDFAEHCDVAIVLGRAADCAVAWHIDRL